MSRFFKLPKYYILIISLFITTTICSQETYFVVAKNGLIIRDQPSKLGKRIGKLSYGSEVKILKNTGVWLTIRDNDQELKGEWVSITLEPSKKSKPTANYYIFSGYLVSKEEAIHNDIFQKQNMEDLHIYSTYSFEINTGDIVNLIPLTDSYPWTEHKDSLAISNHYLGNIKTDNNNYHQLDSNFRSRFLGRMNISEDHNIFVYNVSRDKIFTYRVKDQPLVGILTPYGAQDQIQQYDYIIGFDLNETLKKGINYTETIFTYIGKENPFQTGQLQELIWSKIDYNLFKTNINWNNATFKIRYDPLKDVYLFSMENLDYYLINLVENDQLRDRHLIIVDRSSKTIMADFYYSEGESSSLAPITIKGAQQGSSGGQWTGKMFKNAPPIIFGILYHTFGCPKIDIISESRSSIRLRCDNRH